MAARSRAWFCGRTLAGTVGWNPVGGMDVSLMSDACCRVQVSAMGRSFVWRSHTESDVCECDLETSTMKRPILARVCRVIKNKIIKFYTYVNSLFISSVCVQEESLHGYFALGSDWKSDVVDNQRLVGK
jgi:hypothetical protein